MTNDTVKIEELKNNKHLEAFEMLEGISSKDFDEKDWNRFERFISTKDKEENEEEFEKTPPQKHAVCSNLDIPNVYDTNVNHLDILMTLQANMQKNVYGYDYANMNLREIMDFTHMNNHAIVSELHEFTDSLGGIQEGKGDAIWKRWKKAYGDFQNMKFSDLTEKDQLEAKFELIDILHFVFTFCAMVGMDAKDVFNMYMSKNKENIDRQNRGY